MTQPLSFARGGPAGAAALVGVSGRSPAPGGALGQRQQDFLFALSRAQRATEAAGPDPRQAAEDFVATALVAPVLGSLRASDRTAAPFAPGPAEKQFRALIDVATARQIVRASGFAIVDRIAEGLARRAATAQPQPRSQAPSPA
ncbi:MAG: hypothetical protein C0468_05950 [Planctomyces sp.]|nr:hypothetical protein [Planctomyces sp.]